MMPTRTVTLTLTSCRDCPDHRSQRHYTGDSWEVVFQWHCKAVNNHFVGYEEDGEVPSIPPFCPRLPK